MSELTKRVLDLLDNPKIKELDLGAQKLNELPMLALKKIYTALGANRDIEKLNLS